METSLAVDMYTENETFRAPVKPVMGRLTGGGLPKDSGVARDTLPTGSKGRSSVHIPKHVVAIPLKDIKGNFRLLQRWEGRVLTIDDDSKEFSAVIVDKTNIEMADEKVTLSIEEIPPNDLSLLKSGAVFYWSIGYAEYPGRPRVRESRVRFRRLPKWSKREVSNAKTKGANLAALFSFD